MLKLLNPFFFIIGTVIKKFNLKVRIDEFKIVFPSFMTTLELGRSVLGTYEKCERNLVKKYLKKDDTVLEMGACIGVVALTINKILLVKNNQVSVEPNPQMLEFLLENKKINNADFHVETSIVSRQKEIDFFIGGEAFLSSSTLSGNKKTTVKCKTFEELERIYFPFTAIVMDIEGGELDFLRSFDLTHSKVRVVIWETHQNELMLTQNELNECYVLLTKYGYKCAEVYDKVESWIKN